MTAEFKRTSSNRMTLLRLMAMLAISAVHAAAASPLDRDPLLPDTAYHDGQMATFAYGSDLTREAGNGNPVVARVANGSMIVANSVASPNSIRRDGIGLARFDADGNLTSYDVQLFPSQEPGPSLLTVQDVEVMGANVYVLANRSGDREAPFVAVWSLDLQYRGFSLLTAQEPSWLLPAIGLVGQPDPGNYLYVLGNTRFLSRTGDDRIELLKWELQTIDVGVVGSVQAFPMFIPGCGPLDNCIASTVAQARLPEAPFGLDRYYLAVATQTGGALDRSPMLYRLRGLELQPDPGWVPLRVDFIDVELRHASATAIALDSTLNADVVYLAASVTTCHGIAGVAKIGHGGGSVVASRLFGGDHPPVPCANALRSDSPRSAVFANGRLFVAGTTRPIATDFFRRDGFLAALDRNLHLGEFRSVTFPMDGPRQRESEINGVIAMHDGRVRIVGSATYPQNEADPALRGKAETVHGQFRPDRVFGTGFQLLPDR